MSDDRNRETTIIETGGDRGNGTLIAVVLLIAVLGLLFYLFGGQLMNGAESTDVKVDVDAAVPGDSGSGS